jgi:membrane protein DedA with SNARE-associated domain/rhodanese-related sulfurtransferase
VNAYILLTLSAFAGQAMLFVPLVPLLVSAGALSARGELSPVLAVVALTAGLMSGDFLWYMLGRARGGRILNRLCRAALEPSTCLRRTQSFLGRHGARTLLIAKFIPGLSTLALPMAGVYGMRPRRFLLYDGAGVLAWCTAYVSVGYISAQQLSNLAPGRFSVDARTFGALAASAAVYIAWKYMRRQRGVRQMWTDRITAEELLQRLADRDRPVVVDLRHALDFEADPYIVPGALYIPAEEIARRYREIPRTREVIVYCTCPDETTSIREALRLRARGVRRIRPLVGGFNTWRERQYPVQFHGPVIADGDRLLNVA